MSTATQRTAAQPSGDPDLRAIAEHSPVLRWLGASGTWVLLLDITLILFFGLVSAGHVFWSSQNFQALALEASAGLLLALGMSMLLGAGLFDLSVGANLVLSSVAGAVVMQRIAGPNGTSNVTLAIVAGLLACLAVGLVYGFVNGFIIEILHVNSLITTLGTLGIGSGIALLITNGADISGLPTQIQSSFAFKGIADVPLPALLALAVAGVLWYVLRYTRYGLRTLAIGSSLPSAERAGLRVRQHRISLAMLCGLLAGLAGFVSLADFASTTVNGHTNDALGAITAVVIGGTLLEGGRVRILGTVWGAVLAIVLTGGLVILGAQSFYQLILVGAVLIFAVALDRFNFKRRESR
jgi:ribose transport system permease protein